MFARNPPAIRNARRTWLHRSLAVLAVTMLALALPAGAQTATSAPLAPDRTGMQTRLAACALCHGKLGEGDMGKRGGVYPRLAGQPAVYLYRQLVRFKAERRTGIPPVTTMQWLLANLTPAYMHAIAAFYAASPVQYPPAPHVDAALRAQGRAIVDAGFPKRDIPACTVCHGADLAGRPPATPALAGQSARYLTMQFMHWRLGQRHNALHRQIAATLTDKDMQAVAAYLSTLRPATPSTAP